MTSSPNTKKTNGIRNTLNVNSKGNNNGVLEAGAIGKNGAMPVPGSRNFVNFSISVSTSWLLSPIGSLSPVWIEIAIICARAARVELHGPQGSQTFDSEFQE
jgi:hypothetical protein